MKTHSQERNGGQIQETTNTERGFGWEENAPRKLELHGL